MNNTLKITNSGYVKRYQVEKGSVETITDLPTEGNTDNDVYYVKTEDANYIWNGTAWEINEGEVSGFSIDGELSKESSNPVENKVITVAIEGMVKELTITEGNIVVTKGDGSEENIPIPGVGYDLDGGTP